MFPRFRKEAIIVFQTLMLVFRNYWYVCFVVFVALLLLFLVIWLPNFSFLQYLLTSPSFKAGDKVVLFASSFRLLETNFSRLSFAFTLITVALASLNTALLFYYIRRRIEVGREAGVGIAGFVSGMLGIGCASCGSIIFTYLFGVSATTRFFGILPFGGYELQIVGIVFLAASLWLVSRKIQKPLVCA